MDDIMCIIGVGLLGLILVLLGGFMWSEAKLEGRSELGLALALIGACFLFMDIVIGAQWLNDHLR